MDDFANYFDQFSNVINRNAILDCGFLEMEVLQPIHAAISLFSLHILKTFYNLILDKDTTYSTFLNSFSKPYEELNSTSLKDMQTLNQVFKFSKPKHFKNTLLNWELSQNLINVAQEYSREVCQLISLLFGYGFEYQKGAIFGFGEKNSDNTGTILKLCDLDDEKINQLIQVQIHNHSSNTPLPPPFPSYLQRGGIDFLKFLNKGGDEIFFLERDGLD